MTSAANQTGCRSKGIFNKKCKVRSLPWQLADEDVFLRYKEHEEHVGYHRAFFAPVNWYDQLVTLYDGCITSALFRTKQSRVKVNNTTIKPRKQPIALHNNCLLSNHEALPYERHKGFLTADLPPAKCKQVCKRTLLNCMFLKERFKSSLRQEKHFCS